MDPTDQPSDVLITGYQYCVVLAYGAATYAEYDSTEALVDRLREAYQAAVDTGRADARVFVFAGQRLPVGGRDGRTLTLPDGTVMTLVSVDQTVDDYLLSAADRSHVLG